jgi:hypothetical protein
MLNSQVYKTAIGLSRYEFYVLLQYLFDICSSADRVYCGLLVSWQGLLSY